MRRNRLLTSAAALTAAAALGLAVPRTAVAAADHQACAYVSSYYRPTLGYGATGAAVSQAQCLSNAWGGQPPKLTPDGVYGTALQKKIEWIQTCHGLPESGVIEGRTWQALYHPALDCYVPYPT
ncbi:peptidoglycan-binding domain-containing protein [Streptomyces sp. NPDC004237]|uniref:peptidoglycan-binding domain-containing protein n=1 Tax=Streptomyces sp. NPDC004237 TaxID=3154455 RepID=UPI0033AB67B6